MTADPVVRVRRVLAAPPEEVFDEWLDPDALMDWMCPRPARCVAVHVDPRVGGRVRFDVDDGDGSPLTIITGHILDLDRPNLLRFTWSHSGWADPTAQSIVRVTFEPVETGGTAGDADTLMSIEHTLLPAESFDDHDHGWAVTADQLAAVLVRRSKKPSGK
ncbi:SRPBCC family protein [Mycolicibacterium vaccae]|uniref:SRPBCC family protein n=1 Tax=Mycolicibacterium vaccae TaxID=1810 RepID=UPI003D06ABF1